jgi:hypothetical protein
LARDGCAERGGDSLNRNRARGHRFAVRGNQKFGKVTFKIGIEVLREAFGGQAIHNFFGLVVEHLEVAAKNIERNLKLATRGEPACRKISERSANARNFFEIPPEFIHDHDMALFS